MNTSSHSHSASRSFFDNTFCVYLSNTIRIPEISLNLDVTLKYKSEVGLNIWILRPFIWNVHDFHPKSFSALVDKHSFWSSRTSFIVISTLVSYDTHILPLSADCIFNQPPFLFKTNTYIDLEIASTLVTFVR